MVIIRYWLILLLSADVVELAMSLHIYPYFVLQAANDMVSLHIYTSLPRPSFFDSAMSTNTKIQCAGFLIYSLCY